MSRPPLHILLARPRGFCAGVDRAIHIVERALEKFGQPVYVRHEIVHNRYVVNRLEEAGAIFVDSLDDVPDGQPVIFSAHGVPKTVEKKAADRDLKVLDATCPLVSKVHTEARRHIRAGRHVILIGHAGHPEVIGTMGQVPPETISLVETESDARHFSRPEETPLAYVTQTTLSVTEAAHIIETLKARFPDIAGPRRDGICYATTNRQKAVRQMAPRCDALMVLGAPNTSNSRRLTEVAREAGCPQAMLVQRGVDVDWSALGPLKTLGVTAGASAPEILVRELLDSARKHYDLEVETVEVTTEKMTFRLPPELET